MAVSDVSKTFIAVFRKLNVQPTGCYAGQNLQHFNMPTCRLVTCDIPDCSSQFVRRDEDSITFGNTGGTDDKLRRPSVRPFRFSHGAQKRKDLGWRSMQSLSVGVGHSIWFRDVHSRLTIIQLTVHSHIALCKFMMQSLSPLKLASKCNIIPAPPIGSHPALTRRRNRPPQRRRLGAGGLGIPQQRLKLMGVQPEGR